MGVLLTAYFLREFDYWAKSIKGLMFHSQKSSIFMPVGTHKH